jgi:predicted O-methyltransferase YrrM
VKKFFQAAKYVSYFFSAKSVRSVHSPFVFELVTKVIHGKNNFYSFDKIENLRSRLFDSDTTIDVHDLGTGKSGKRKIREIAEKSLTTAKYCKLLFRLANHFSPAVILELGTSLGISTAYLARADLKTKVITIEGSESILYEARKNFEILGLKNIETVFGNFDDVLEKILMQYCLPQTDQCVLVFFDGNHRYESTMRYFRQCLAYANNDSLFVFDDIRWSEEMEKAWEEIKQHPRITVTIDLFSMGIVFFRKEQAKQDFVIRF